MSKYHDKYHGLHSQILFDLQQFYIGRIDHYRHLDILADACRRELVEVEDAIFERDKI